jgi:hypothetical protein
MTTVNVVQLHDKAMLAYISVSTWSARKLDRKATKQVTENASATTDAARVNKHLLASADKSLKEIAKIGTDARRFLEANSLPWDDAGNRLIDNLKAIEIVGAITQMEKDYLAAVEAFIVEYPVLRAQAISNLGDMAADEDYPQPDRLREKFSMRLSLNPLPEGFGDARMGLSPPQVDALQRQFEARIRMQFNIAIEAAWKRLREVVAAIAERMDNSADPSKRKIFRDSLFENARETCALLQSLNVFDEPNLNQVRYEVEHYLLQHEPDAVRASVDVADTLSFKANELLDRMKEFLGE